VQAEALQVTRPEVAIQFLDRCLAQNPRNTQALEMKAVLLLQNEDADQARALLETCAELEPHFGWSKYMYLGQVR
jgi:Flp pilus assembly protein TadD